MLRNGNEGMSTIPGFSQIQFEGFCRFINQALAEELDKFPTIKDPDHEIAFQLFAKGYQLLEPSIKERDAVYESLTYSSELYVSARLIFGFDVQKQTISIGNIPIMNSLGTFIINGIYRIVINQILLSPGIYYRSELDHKGISIYTGTIISDWGGRSELAIDKKERIWARVSRKQKISILVLSSAMGSNLREILDNVSYPEFFLSFPNAKEKKRIESKENAILEFYQQFACVGGDLVFSESLCEELQKKFFQQKCELGRIGRRNMNRRLNLDIPQNNTFLLPRDVLAATDHLIGMKFGTGILDDDDMNHLKNKRIRSVADLLQDQFGLALGRLQHAVQKTIRRVFIRQSKPTPQTLVTPTSTSILLITTYETFFGTYPLSQVFDQTNPLTQTVHGRKVSCLGPGGLTGRTASFRSRDIHPSHYGRICPIDTSEGINVGLTGSLAIHARIDHLWGSIESPFYEISAEKEKKKKARQVVYLSPNRDEYYMIAAGNSLSLNQGIQEEQVVPARYRQEFLTIAWEQIHVRSIFPFQYFSIGGSLIPFIEHNDANRALMSSNMQRQAVPLSRSEKCIVGTGLERQTALDSRVSIIAEREGKIVSTDSHKILLSSSGKTLSIPLVNHRRSNKNTCMHQKPRVPRGKSIKKGQILAEGAATVGGELALGKNVLVAYMPWEGYNFEDAVLISERLVYEDIYTSFHIRKYEIQTDTTSQGSAEKITKEIPHLEEHLLRNLDRNGVVRLGSWVETGDILVGKLTPQIASESSYIAEAGLLRAIFGLEVSTSKETSLKLPIGGRGRVIDVKWIQRDPLDIMVRVYILQKREIKVGDKVAGRHGNKGIISKILPRQDMPYLQDGTPVDMVFNPLGVPSRMNVGQIFESSLGLAGDLLKKHYRIAPFDERYEQEASRKLVFSELYEASKETKNPWVFEPEYPGKSRIFDGRTGDPFEQPVLIGKSYILKLIHQVDEKIHGRSTGPYSLVTQQPVRGRAKQGGQRVGEMEVWALEGFGVAHILQEILTYKSDHLIARQEILNATIWGKRIPNHEDPPESFRVLVRELRSLALELNHFLVSEKNFQVTREEV
uniref:DNA-directed RNA polymerase subunit beta n=15 Tax=Poeae TaxID=147387 RepID=A0A4D6JBQ0_9POAL|nr:RNA polymerase beta subunit [Poa palustris]YP_009461287.1 RNA polymerase beta subunit [Poa nemoralis]YP_009461374.1 RNA polymerase beta subunit [Poa trivialis]YP_009649947.1 RNA polymerase beta subunit [Poa sp. PI 374046]YP_010175076.1 RNA polymerase beta subunit [Poa pratensis]YP_010217976.1 RNA polymerase beta subunit [Nicoraepoa erinacea]YP_010245337.1 RNA polymerase beta subunit [Bellardiochloa variegata]QHD18719.1 RpoB [Poa pagophila]QHD18877.1 RpoB [Poa sphondylodes]QHD18956.1 Rpo